MKRLFIFAFVLCVLTTGSFAQKTVGLDNWFNHETNAKTGKIFHYTWDDQENQMANFTQGDGQEHLPAGSQFKDRNDMMSTANLQAAQNLFAQ